MFNRLYIGFLLLSSFPIHASESDVEADSRSPEDPQQSTSFDLGGAIRFNYGWKDYSADSNGSFDFELFRIDFKARHKNWFFDGQYRWYKDFDAIHHAFIGYQIDDTQHITAGVSQVPFGIEPYASHSFWFGGTYYLGLEDDYDLGVAWRKVFDNKQLDLAYFTGSEYSPGEYGRYSFDVAAVGETQTKEDGQLNARLQYSPKPNHTLGISTQLGQIKNTQTGISGDHWAMGAHYDGHIEQWNLQAQLVKYRYDNKPGLNTGDYRLNLSAFLFPFEIATDAWVTSLNAARTFETNNRFADSITCYNNATITTPADRPGLADSIQNVSGCLFVKGGLYTYVDWIAGKNMWFAGGPGVGINDGETGWHSRLNINFGYYF